MATTKPPTGQPPALPLGALLSCWLDHGARPASCHSKDHPKTPTPPAEAPPQPPRSQVPAQAQAPEIWATETYEDLLFSDICCLSPTESTTDLTRVMTPDPGPLPAKQGGTLGTDDKDPSSLQTTTFY